MGVLMPELPEVETTMRGLKPHLEGSVIEEVVLRHHQLRWPIPSLLKNSLNQQAIQTLSRRGKYILIPVATGTLIIHLGMSGSLRMVNAGLSPRKHDHVDCVLSNKMVLRYHDPRRFGAILWTEHDPLQHPLLKSLGVEPLSSSFTAAYLKDRAAGRRMAIKPFIMHSSIVVGVGNIYAAESLFLAKINPNTPSGSLSLLQYEKLVNSIQNILSFAISQGGTTLKDFVNSEGKPGYFAQQLSVYGRAGLPCVACGKLLEKIVLGQRSTVFCSHCQPIDQI